jgi:hypothetical protein
MKKEMSSLLIFLLASVSGFTCELHKQNTREIECSIKPIDRSKIHPPGNTSDTSNQAVSSNWSGYVAAPSLQQSIQGSVTYAAGSWIVPTLSPTPDTSYCAVWVGIDGFLDGTVEQIGTSHNWVGSAQQNFAWFEMYPSGAFELDGFPVNNGDQISVRIGYKGDNTFKLVIFNHTQGVSTVIPSSFTTSPDLERSSAEWIVEAPFSGTILPLADFHLVTFNYCSAIINGVSGTINNGLWVNDSITMEDSSGIEAQPSALQKEGTCFLVTWESE